MAKPTVRKYCNFISLPGALLSAFAIVYERTNTLGNPSVFNKVMERLSHRGPDGSDVVSTGSITMEHWHFWTTPEEVGEHQPLVLSGLPFRIVLDGRIDNREELFSELSIAPAEGKSLSDAALVLRAYARWGEDCFQHLVGEFALAIFDEQKNELICARDPLGDRTLFYTSFGTQIVVASEPWAAAGAKDTSPELNECAIAHYFSFSVPEDGQTFFNNIYELLPAHIMTINADSQRTRCYWQPDLGKRIRYKTNEEYVEHFLALLEESVRCRIRSATPVGVFMSGGLDSTSVACTAARMMDSAPLTTISYVFDEFTDCDERQYINAVKDKWNMRSIQIPCDDAWPYRDWDKQIPSQNQPGGNFYHTIKDRLYKKAQDEGIRVVLHGGFGDHLHAAGSDWLVDLILDGRLRDAIHEVNLHINTGKYHKIFNSSMLRRIIRRMINSIPGGSKLHRRTTVPAWLTPLSAGYILNAEKNIEPSKISSALANLITAYGNSRETFNFKGYNVEIRYPYRDRRLVEFALSLPAYQFYYRSSEKYILRAAMQDILPEIVRTRVNKTSLIPFFSHGVKREMNSLKSFYQNTNAAWRKFVSADWLEGHWNLVKDNSEAVVPTLCVSYEAWYQSLSLLN